MTPSNLNAGLLDELAALKKRALLILGQRAVFSAATSHPQPTPNDQRPPSIEFGQLISVSNETAKVAPCAQPDARSILVTRTIPAVGGVAVMTSIFWPERPTGNSAGYYRSIGCLKETRIEGLTTRPILLHDSRPAR